MIHNLRIAPIVAASCLLAPASGQELFKLRASDAAAMDRFGVGVDLHRGRILVGASLGDGASANTGAAYLFDLEQGGELRKLIAADGELEDFFGSAVALSDTRALVGSPLDVQRAGSVYVFDPATGMELTKLLASDGLPLDEFGSALDVCGDLAVVGAYGANGLEGAAYLFDLTTAQETAKLTPPGDPPGALFGSDVATDGVHVAVGAPGELVSEGAAHVYDTDGALVVTLRASDGQILDGFGRGIDIYGDRVAVGAPFAGGAVGQGAGAVYVFDLAGRELHRLEPDGVTLGDFGANVALGADRVVVGDPADASRGPNSGSVYVFELETGRRLAKHSAKDAQSEQRLGLNLALDGYRAIAGASGDLSASGSAYQFLVHEAPRVYCTAKTNSCGTRPSLRTCGASSASAGHGFTIEAGNTVARKMGLLLYSNSGASAAPFQGGTLCVDPSSLRRSTPTIDTSGTALQCDGVLAIDMNAFAAGALGGVPARWLIAPGTRVHAQFWGRDKNSAAASLLSDAVEFVVGP